MKNRNITEQNSLMTIAYGGTGNPRMITAHRIDEYRISYIYM